ncbi:hypothetical protein IWX65_001258 [Arthrobacter sp. CAN_A214]|uniref:DUF4190 domain-containing protein n=1 Tax=Arthrobacter sp. CAN_A214 TaxID=2787720 RepID=UPI0018CBC6C4
MSSNIPGPQQGGPDQNDPPGSQPQYGQSPQGQSPYGQPGAPPPYGQSPQGQSPYGQPGAQAQYGQSPYSSDGGGYPGQQGYGAPPRDNPGRTLGIVGFVLAFIPFLNPVGVIVSIIALVKSKKAGMGNGLAVAGIIIGALATIGLVLLIAGLVAAAPLIQEVAEFCEQAGPGPQIYNGQEIDCGPA